MCTGPGRHLFCFETGQVSLSVVLTGLELRDRLPHLLSAGIKGVLQYTGSPEKVFVESLLLLLLWVLGWNSSVASTFIYCSLAGPGHTFYYWGTTGKMLVFPKASSN